MSVHSYKRGTVSRPVTNGIFEESFTNGDLSRNSPMIYATSSSVQNSSLSRRKVRKIPTGQPYFSPVHMPEISAPCSTSYKNRHKSVPRHKFNSSATVANQRHFFKYYCPNCRKLTLWNQTSEKSLCQVCGQTVILRNMQTVMDVNALAQNKSIEGMMHGLSRD